MKLVYDLICDMKTEYKWYYMRPKINEDVWEKVYNEVLVDSHYTENKQVRDRVHGRIRE